MKARVVAGTVMLLVGSTAVCRAHGSADKLPEGPLRDRHELMEGIGKNAKVIGDAMKSGKLEGVAPAAEKIEAAAGKVLALFPKGSTHEHSRAKAEIWSDWDKFESITKAMGSSAGELAAAAKAGGDVPQAAQKMFGTCKACHDSFRLPEKKEK